MIPTSVGTQGRLPKRFATLVGRLHGLRGRGRDQKAYRDDSRFSGVEYNSELPETLVGCLNASHVPDARLMVCIPGDSIS